MDVFTLGGHASLLKLRHSMKDVVKCSWAAENASKQLPAEAEAEKEPAATSKEVQQAVPHAETVSAKTDRAAEPEKPTAKQPEAISTVKPYVKRCDQEELCRASVKFSPKNCHL